MPAQTSFRTGRAYLFLTSGGHRFLGCVDAVTETDLLLSGCSVVHQDDWVRDATRTGV